MHDKRQVILTSQFSARVLRVSAGHGGQLYPGRDLKLCQTSTRLCFRPTTTRVNRKRVIPPQTFVVSMSVSPFHAQGSRDGERETGGLQAMCNNSLICFATECILPTGNRNSSQGNKERQPKFLTGSKGRFIPASINHFR